MKMTNAEYSKLVDKHTPNSPIAKNMLFAFLIGGTICCIGQAFCDLGLYFGLEKDLAVSLSSMGLIFLAALLTGLGVYDDIASIAGAGTLVPITGFSNAVVSPALEFKSEGFITGTASKMLIIAGPVIIYGISASVIYGLILVLLEHL